MKIKSLDITNEAGNHIQVTIDEARELYDELCKLFGNPTRPLPIVQPVIIRDHWVGAPYTWYTNSCSYAGQHVFLSYNGDTSDPA